MATCATDSHCFKTQHMVKNLNKNHTVFSAYTFAFSCISIPPQAVAPSHHVNDAELCLESTWMGYPILSLLKEGKFVTQ